MSLLGRVFSMRGWKTFLQGSEDLSTPDVTRVQALALGQAVIVVLVVLGLDLDADTQQILLALSATLGTGLSVSDAVIRRGRAANAEGIAVAQDAKTGAEATTDAAVKPLIALDQAERDALQIRLARMRSRG
jgi:hypothetical protein